MNGVYVQDLATRKANGSCDGLSFNYALTGIDGAEAVIGTPEGGYRRRQGLSAATLDGARCSHDGQDQPRRVHPPAVGHP